MLAIAIPGLFALRSAQAAVNTIVVNTNSDSGICSGGTITLRCAIAMANANTTNPTTIAFNFSGIITVGSVLTINNTAQPITIDSSGHSIIVDGAKATQIFSIATKTSVTLNTLTISNGNAGNNNGGGVYNAGTLTINSSMFSGNSSAMGGGLFNAGTLTINSSMFSGNSAGNGGSGLFNATGTLASISNTTFISNTTSGDGGGLNNFGGVMLIASSTFSGNSVFGNGGGVYNSGTLTLSNSTFSGNSAVQAGVGGGLFNAGTLTLSNSTFSGNSAGNGGSGLFNATGKLAIITNTTFVSNTTSGDGGGLNNFGGVMLITGSTFSGNSVFGNGGGVFNSGRLTLSNSTFSGNSADQGGGLFHLFNLLTISSSTFSGNSAINDGGGIRTVGVMNLLSTLIAKNSVSVSDPDVYGAFTSLGHNLIGDPTGSSGLTNGTNGDQVGTPAAPIDPKLGALANNNGLTQTMAPLNGSPAISKGDCTGNSISNPPAPVVMVDQRGFGRKSPCDVGAYETNATVITDTPLPTNTPTSTSTSTLTHTPTVTSTSTATATNTSTSTATSTNTPTATNTVTATGTRVPSAIDSIGVYANGLFYLSLHNATGMADLTTAFNPAGKNIPIVGDWTGAGYDSIGVYDQNAGNFTLCTSNVTATCALPADQIAFTLGNPNDTPLAGRWTSSALHTGAGVYRPSNGILYVKNTLTTGAADHAMVLGNPGDQGLVGDWTSKGYDSTGVYRPTNSLFYLSNQIGDGIIFSDQTLQFGTGGVAITGDWIGQGHDGVGLYNTSASAVFLKNTLTTGLADTGFTYGSAGAQPIAGHWQLIYPPGAPLNQFAPILIPKTAAPHVTPQSTPNSGSVPGGNQISG